MESLPGLADTNNDMFDYLATASTNNQVVAPQSYNTCDMNFDHDRMVMNLADPSFPNNSDYHRHGSRSFMCRPSDSNFLRLPEETQELLARDISAILESTVETGTNIGDGVFILQSSNRRGNWNHEMQKPLNHEPNRAERSASTGTRLGSELSLSRKRSVKHPQHMNSGIAKKSTRTPR